MQFTGGEREAAADAARVLTVLLAGGAGERLLPLTRHQAKPMVPFGGVYRLIDITLSNCVNSGLRQIYILTQHKALTLNRHVREHWNILSSTLGEFIEVVPPTKRLRETWYLGTADAVSQNIQSIEDERRPFVLIVSADHVYKMNYQHMLAQHVAHAADVSLATTQVAPAAAGRYGIVALDPRLRVLGFEEKPQHGRPDRSNRNPEACSASMGIYLFSTPVLLEALREDAANLASSHDFGRDVLPRLLARGRRIYAYDFVDENKKEVRYWRDVGTLDAYFEANMDLVAVSPVFNLYADEWPIRSAPPLHPPAKFVFSDAGLRMGVALDSMVSQGCVISGGRVLHSVLSPGVRIDSYAEVSDSILFSQARIGRSCRIRRAIIDQGVHIPAGSEIGYDLEADRRAGHFITDSGIVVVSAEDSIAALPRGASLAQALAAPADGPWKAVEVGAGEEELVLEAGPPARAGSR